MLSIKPKNINQESLELSKNVKRSPGMIGWNSRFSFDFSQVKILPLWWENRKPEHMG